jgi:hypothetical protein
MHRCETDCHPVAKSTLVWQNTPGGGGEPKDDQPPHHRQVQQADIRDRAEFPLSCSPLDCFSMAYPGIASRNGTTSSWKALSLLLAYEKRRHSPTQRFVQDTGGYHQAAVSFSGNESSPDRQLYILKSYHICSRFASAVVLALTGGHGGALG